MLSTLNIHTFAEYKIEEEPPLRRSDLRLWSKVTQANYTLTSLEREHIGD